MKKLKLFFACLLMAVLSIGQVWGADQLAYTIEFQPTTSNSTAKNTSNFVSDLVTSGASYISSCTATARTYPDVNQIKLGSSSGTGSFTLSLSESGQVKATKVVLSAKYYDSGKTITLTANSTSETFTPTNAFADYEVTLDGESNLTTISVASVTASKGRMYVNAIKVYVADGGGSTPTPSLSVSPSVIDFGTVDQNAVVANKTVAVTFENLTGSVTYGGLSGAFSASGSISATGDEITISANTATVGEYSQTLTVQSAADSKSQDVTVKMNVVEPFDGSVLEIVKDDFTNTGYDDNAGDHEKSGITFTTAKVYQSGGGIQFQKTNGLLYNKTDLGEIAKIEITTVSGKSNNLVVYSGTTENPTTGEVTGNASGSVTTYTFAAGKGFFAIKCNSTGASNVDPIKIYYVYSAPAVATPSISGATPFATTTTVTLGCTTDGASIYYTTDGSDPSSSSTLYEDPFELNTGATVKAIAILGSDQSSIASKEFEKVASYTTLADIFTKATEVGNTATDIYVTFGGWKVSAKTSNNVFLTDGTNGAVIYGSGHGFNAGDVLTGTVACKVQLYKGFAELTSLNSATPGLTVTPGSVGDPVVKTWGQLSAVNTGALVQLKNLTYDGSSLSDGVNTIPTYTTFYTATFEAGKSYNLTGVYQYYDTDGQILPRSAADVEEIVETFTVTYDNAPEHGTLTIKNGDDVVTSGSAVNEGTVLDIITTPAEDYKLDGVTVNGSAYAESTLTLTENVTIAATFVVNEAPLVETYVLSEIGVETSHLVSGMRVGDKVNLPLTATECSKTFRGWSANASCTVAPENAPGAEITLAANNKFYAVYADANIVTPTDHALGSLTVGGTSGNTASEGYTYTSNKTNDKAGYTQDSGTKDADIVHLQIKAASQIINEEPSAIIVTAHLGAGADRDELTYPVNAVLVDAEGNNVGDPVVLTNSIPDKNGADFSANLPTANYANVRGVKISHMKEDGWNVRYYSMSFKYQTGGTTYDNYSTDCQAAVATPTFSPAAGTYTEAQNVTISTETEDATIYYTTNGDEPTASSTLYEGAITVDADMTIKAIAVKAGMANSAVASADFEINLPLSTMDAIFAAAEAAGGTATDANITFGNWVVSGVSTNGKNVYVTDGTKGFIIFDNGGEMGFAVGDVLSGTVACKVQLYNGAAELTTLSSTTEGLNVATGGVITPEVKAISALSGINTGAAVTINSVQFDGTNLSDGANDIKPYNSLFAYEALENGKYYNVTGIYLQFGANTKEILPRSAADIEEVSLSDPEINYTPASATIELGEDLPGTVFANPHELAISYNSNNEAVATVSNTGVIALGTETGTAVITASFAGDATYAAANVTYTITVNPASVSENVVILAVYDTKYYAMSTNNASSAFTAIAVEYDGTQITVNSAEDKAAIQWTKKTSGDNTTFQDANDKYMKSADGTSMSLQDAVCNWIWDGTGEYYKISGTSRTFFYQSGTGFKNFATSNLNKSGYSGKAQVIAIAAENIVISSKVSAELAYTPSEVTLTVGSAFTPAVLNYAEGFDGLAAVTYASNNEDVATVDESGVVSLVTDAIGTATITATFDGNNNYLAGSASYTITVNEAGDDLSGTWVLATSVAAGDKIIIMGANNADIYTMGKQNTNNRAAVASTLSEDVLNPGAATKVFTLVDAGGSKFAIQASNGNYLTSATSGTSNNLLEAADYELDNAKWTIAIENGSYSIVAAAGSKTVMQYNSGSTIFSCYGSASQKPVKIFKRDAAPEPPTPVYETVRESLTPNNYYTICYPKSMTDIQGATLWSFVGRDANFAYIEQETATTIEAGKPYIMYATASTVTAILGTDVASAGVNGAIHGTLDPMVQSDLDDAATDAGNDVYLVIGNELRRATGASTGSNTLPAYRAFVVVDEIPNVTPVQGNAPGKKYRKMPMQGQTTTGCELINAAEAPAKMMINGQLFILRGEKKYDATGRLVK